MLAAAGSPSQRRCLSNSHHDRLVNDLETGGAFKWGREPTELSLTPGGAVALGDVETVQPSVRHAAMR